MIWVFAIVVGGFGLWALRDEFRRGGSLRPQPQPVPVDDVWELFAMSEKAGWDPFDVMHTLDEIAAL